MLFHVVSLITSPNQAGALRAAPRDADPGGAGAQGPGERGPGHGGLGGRHRLVISATNWLELGSGFGMLWTGKSYVCHMVEVLYMIMIYH